MDAFGVKLTLITVSAVNTAVAGMGVHFGNYGLATVNALISIQMLILVLDIRESR